MSLSLSEIFAAVSAIAELEKKIEELVGSAKEAINAENDKKRRKALMAAFERRDLDALRQLLFDV